MSKKYNYSWIEDLDIEEQIKLRKINRRKTIEDNPLPKKGGTTIED